MIKCVICAYEKYEFWKYILNANLEIQNLVKKIILFKNILYFNI